MPTASRSCSRNSASPIASEDFAMLLGIIIALPNTAGVAELLGNCVLEDMV